MRVLVTGAGGFIGRSVVAHLSTRGYRVRASSTSVTSDAPDGVEIHRLATSQADIDWGDAATGMDAIVHLAGRAHVMREQSADPIEEFRRINVRASLELAKRAVEAHVRHLVFVSSIGVNGSSTCGAPFTEASVPAPVEPYAVSKWEAEQALQAFVRETDLKLTVVRLPLVYGPAAKGNFRRLLRLVELGLPLPLGSVRNLRSYVGVGNVADFLELCLRHPGAQRQLFLLADGEDISTPGLIEMIAAAMRRPARLMPFPLHLLRGVAQLAGRRGEIDRLTGSLRVDASHARNDLGWDPPVSLSVGIAAMSEWYVRDRGS